MSTHFLDYKNRILDLRAAERGAREEKEKAVLRGDRGAEKIQIYFIGYHALEKAIAK